jgi:hypothetical protein
MSGEPRVIRAVDIFEGTRGLWHRYRRDPSAYRLPRIPVGDRKSFEHVRFTRDDAPAMADNVVKETLSAVRANVSLQEELAAPGDQPAPQSGITQLLGSLVRAPLSEKPLVPLARLNRVAHHLSSWIDHLRRSRSDEREITCI